MHDQNPGPSRLAPSTVRPCSATWRQYVSGHDVPYRECRKGARKHASSSGRPDRRRSHRPFSGRPSRNRRCPLLSSLETLAVMNPRMAQARIRRAGWPGSRSKCRSLATTWSAALWAVGSRRVGRQGLSRRTDRRDRDGQVDSRDGMRHRRYARRDCRRGGHEPARRCGDWLSRHRRVILADEPISRSRRSICSLVQPMSRPRRPYRWTCVASAGALLGAEWFGRRLCKLGHAYRRTPTKRLSPSRRTLST